MVLDIISLSVKLSVYQVSLLITLIFFGVALWFGVEDVFVFTNILPHEVTLCHLLDQ